MRSHADRIGNTQLRVLLLVMEGHARRHPYTLREIAAKLGVNVFAVQNHVAALTRLGLVDQESFRNRKSPRTLRPLCRLEEA